MDTPPIRLFMVELLVEDWPAAVEWYVGSFGLTLNMKDEARRFALLGDDRTGRLALKEVSGHKNATFERTRLVFQVEDLPATRKYLLDQGVAVSEILRNDREAYSEVRLIGPGGTSITIFSFSRIPDEDGKHG